MKKKHHHRKQHRNNGSGPPPRPRPAAPRPPRPPRGGEAQDWKTAGAVLIGGAGGAAIGGLLVNQKILSPEAVGLGLMLGGGATAYYAGGAARVVGASAAAAGAGQLALAFMGKQALKSATGHPPQVAQATNQSGQPAAQLPAPPAEPPRRSASGGGVVLDLFHDAATDLDMLDDEWRFAMRDDAGPFVIDLDEAA